MKDKSATTEQPATSGVTTLLSWIQQGNNQMEKACKDFKESIKVGEKVQSWIDLDRKAEDLKKKIEEIEAEGNGNPEAVDWDYLAELEELRKKLIVDKDKAKAFVDNATSARVYAKKMADAARKRRNFTSVGEWAKLMMKATEVVNAAEEFVLEVGMAQAEAEREAEEVKAAAKESPVATYISDGSTAEMEADADSEAGEEMEIDVEQPLGAETSSNDKSLTHTLFPAPKKHAAHRERAVRKHVPKKKKTSVKHSSRITDKSEYVSTEMFAKFQKFTEKGKTYKVKEEGYFHDHGALICKCCGKAVAWNNRYKHVQSNKHVKAKAKFAERQKVNQLLLSESKGWKEPANIVGQSLSDAEQLHRLKVAQMFARGNIAYDTLDEIEVCSHDAWLLSVVQPFLTLLHVFSGDS